MGIAIRSRAILLACMTAGMTAGLALTPQAMAQQDGQMTDPGAQAPAVEVSEEKLQSFAVAFAQVESLKQEYTERLQQAGDETQQQEIRSEANQRLLQAVDETDGISVDEYNLIIQSAQADPELAQRLTTAIDETGQ